MNTTPALRTLGSRTITARRIAAACGAGVLLLGASACGSSDPKNAAASSGNQGNNSYGGPATNQQGGQRPGTDGKVAAVSGRTAQVQSQQSGQVAVSWTASTAFTKQVSAKLADVKVGDCVMVTSSDTSATSTPGTQPTAVTAAAVRITAPVSGSCTPTIGPGAGGGPQLQGYGGGNAQGGQPPAGGQAPGGTRPQFRGLGGAFGTVTSVKASGFVVESVRPTGTGSTTPAKTEVTVTVTKATTYSTTAKGAASDVKVGVCVRADGSADDTGAIAATHIQITPAVNGECGVVMRRSVNGAAPGSVAQAS